ncbi:MAG: S9 family peptidase [Chloroflexi bacterium]|nr:S9 family peptidase [Chloroflexota bacterium]
MAKIIRPFGTWPSPITPLSLAQKQRLAEIGWDDGGALIWLEGRSDRDVLVVQPPGGGAPYELNAELSVRARVGYGGGDFCAGKGRVYFVEAKSGRIYRQALADGGSLQVACSSPLAQPVTPAFGSAAAPRLSPDGRWLLYVHSYEGVDALAVVDAEGRAWPRKLVSGDDFYMQPAWSADGASIAWVAWNHPQMPWDGARLHTARLEFPRGGLPILRSEQDARTPLAGGEQISIFQPEFSPDGRALAYISDEDGWWQLYLYDLSGGPRRQLTRGAAEVGLPAWVQGMRVYAFAPDGKRIYYLRNEAGFTRLHYTDLHGERSESPPLEEEITWCEQICVSPASGEIALIASGWNTPSQVIAIQPGGAPRTLRSASAGFPPEACSRPQPLAWQGLDGGEVHGLFLPPHSTRYTDEGLPPLMVIVHHGPTSQRTAAFDAQAQFFASRGWAALLVNHRGSTGYGRAYRDALRDQWGVLDVEDVVSGARRVAEMGLADGGRAAILGSSAGGFTVLTVLEQFPGVFKAGVDLYGVSDLFAAAQDTHKFETRYNDFLLGALPTAAEVWRRRSPVYFADQIRDPLAIFQGENDAVVPRSQSDAIAASLQRRGVTHLYHLYPGEGHGFRKAETIEHVYSEMARFLRDQVVLA